MFYPERGLRWCGSAAFRKTAEFMHAKILGVVIPDAVVERLRQTPQEKKRAEGKKICVEIIQQVREIAGVARVHVMAYRQEELVSEIVEEAGLLPHPLGTNISDPANRARPKTGNA